MSFIAIGDRAPAIGNPAFASGLCRVTASIFHISAPKAGPDADPQVGNVPKVALALIVVLSSAVLGVAVLRPDEGSQPAPQIHLELHSTCSLDRDCWVAKPETDKPEHGRNRAGEAERLEFSSPRKQASPAQSDGAGPRRAIPFGAVTSPSTPWSGAPTASRKASNALRSSRQKLSAAMSVQSKSRLAAKQGKPAKDRSTL